MKIKIPYYKASEQERKGYNDYNLIMAVRKIDYNKYHKEFAEAKLLILIGFLMPVFWWVFEIYAKTFAIWLLDVNIHMVPFLMGAFIGFGIFVFIYSIKIQPNYKMGIKIVGENFIKIHKQNSRFAAMFFGIFWFGSLFLIGSRLDGGGYAQIEVFLLAVVSMMALAFLSMQSNEYAQCIKYEVMGE